ncbi:MAG TPA: HEAT repeat domain-containing protein [Candidatus Eisenbacteria bacterium]|nr:HEAT repeat domain-containing protein [Candidatus Eisenbacteria bacterium]
MIDFEVLVVTLALLLGVVALTTVAAIANKIYSNREEDSKRAFLDHLRKQFLLLSIPEEKERALREIGAGISGRWSQIAAEEVRELELETRLDVIRSLEERGVVARFLKDARSRLKWTRAHALRVLGELKVPASVPTLLSALEDKDPDVRNVAARSLGRMKLQAAEEALVGLLGKHEQSVSARIAAICIEMGPRTGPLLIRTLRDGPPKARFWAARILGEIRDARATRSLGDALLDPEPDVRSAATWALGSVADRSTGPLVESVLQDPVWFVRAHAAESLGKIGDPAFVGALGKSLEDRSWWVRRNAMEALIRLGDPAKPVLTRMLESNDRFARDCAVEALTGMGVAVVLPSALPPAAAGGRA